MHTRETTESAGSTAAGEKAPAGGGILLTPEQVANAPAEVRNWLLNSIFNIEASEDHFILEQNGVATSGEGLAVCSLLEIKELIRRLSEDYLVLQVFFELGCDYQNPTTGERRPYLLKFADFRRHTDVDGIQGLLRCIHDINEALQNLRGDTSAMLCRIDSHEGFHVHEITQHRIYHFWLLLSALAARHSESMSVPTPTAMSLDASPAVSPLRKADALETHQPPPVAGAGVADAP
jgi:hypothetical protein